MNDHSPQQSSIRPPHPLAVELIGRLRDRFGAAVLEVGRGSGRNTAALERAGFRVVGFDRSGQSAAAALSTHALLHGAPHQIEALLERIAAQVTPGAPLYATFGSVNDRRFGQGTRLGPATFAAESGDEVGVAHTYYGAEALRKLLHPQWIIESAQEQGVDDIAGSWAHENEPLRDAVHWFVRARRR